MKSNELKQGLILGSVATISIAIIVMTYLGTRDAIRTTEQRELEAKLIELFEPQSYTNQPSRDTIELTDSALGSQTPKIIYRARNQGVPSGAVVSATAPDGYNGNIDLLIGLNMDGDIVGVRVTNHMETPGLGDDIDLSRSDWIRAFDGLSLRTTQAYDWKVKKDGGQFDQFTGATITPRAVVNAVYRVASWYQIEKDNIFAN